MGNAVQDWAQPRTIGTCYGGAHPASTAALSRGPPAALAHRMGLFASSGYNDSPNFLDPAMARTAARRLDDCERTSVVQRLGGGFYSQIRLRKP